MISFEFSNQKFQTGRVIGDLNGSDGPTSTHGPTLVLFGGVHGNEPSGVIAIQRVFAEIQNRQIQLHGRLLGLAGNLVALAAGRRFVDQDLNRIWDRQFTQRFSHHRLGANATTPSDPASNCTADEVLDSVAEYREQVELFEFIDPMLQQTSAEKLYFIDLHTTSSRSEPFIAINDQLDNRRFALTFPVPTVLGIEEYLAGPLLSYLNDFGPVAMAFEAGQHEDPESVTTHESFIWMALVNAGLIRGSDLVDLMDHQRHLKCSVTSGNGIYEVIFRKAIQEDDRFEMEPGFRNFSNIDKGEKLASDRQGTIEAPMRAKVFMPLYQNSGNDGFFLVRQVPGWALSLSSILRRFRFEKMLVWLPGVSRCEKQPDALLVNKRVARFLANELFHLLGYRRKSETEHEMVFSRREIAN
ncbi:MAG: succinylglutamate desuccinylase/aspartoacylase family protein [Planctomycetota bacterium]